MFKGIQKSTLLLSLLMLVSPASYANQADRASDEMTSSSSSSGAAASTRVAYDEGDLLSKKMKGCENTAGSYNRMVGEPRTTVISETATEKIEEVCQRVECAYTVGDGGGSFDFDDMDRSLSERAGQNGAMGAAFGEKCETYKTTRQRVRDEDRGGNDDSGSGGRVSGDGKFVIKFEGSLYTCDADMSFDDCLRANGVVASGITFTVDGVDGNGRKIVIARRGGVSVGDRVDVTAGGSWQVPGLCVEEKCNWWTLCIKKKKVLREECLGAGIGTSEGYEYHVGGDIDLGGKVTPINRRGGAYYVRYNGRRFRCAAGESESQCLGRYGHVLSGGALDLYNCADCRGRWSRGRGNNGDTITSVLGATAQLAGAILPPVMMYKGMKVQANAYLGANQAWAGAAATGFEQCQIMQTNYVTNTYAYYSDNELPGDTVVPPECRGYSLGQFAGTQGWRGNGYGGFGSPWGSAGYSNAFLAQMYGSPYQYNLGTGVTGMIGGNGFGGNAYLNGGSLGSLFGLPSINAQLSLGGNLGGGWGGVPYSMNTGWGANPQLGGNFAFGGNPYFNGANTGYGWNTGGNTAWNSPYFNGNLWGSGAQGTVPWQNGGGSYWNNSQNGNGWWAAQNSLASNQQAAMGGSYYQQMALQDQAGQAMNNLNYQGGAPYMPAYSPMNMGASINAGFGIY
ncbi:MAG: hypothetical protein CME66_09415 [Halobacteriovoraceae bacterium]|nr:hypothetical protein [Halobacteriovoraceae bacterium]